VGVSGLVIASLAGAAAVPACDGEENQYVFSEPIVVHGAQFFSGALPGTPELLDAALADADAGAAPDAAMPSGPPVVTSVQSLNTTVYSGEAAKQISGRATDIASAVGIRLGGLGTGYWVLPMGNPDPQFPGELSFSASIDFNLSIPPGLHPLRVVAIGADGIGGAESDQTLCIASRLPGTAGGTFTNDISACNPSATPPDAVFALTWDADVDLDLHVVTPDGVDVNPKHPLVDPVDAGGTVARTAPRIDRDSLASCLPDGWREEDLAFTTLPASGSVFQIRANLFSACSKPSVTFTFTVYQSVGTAGVDRHLVQAFQRSGALTSLDADGDGPGLFVVSYPF
jgi:hypothetical protein